MLRLAVGRGGRGRSNDKGCDVPDAKEGRRGGPEGVEDDEVWCASTNALFYCTLASVACCPLGKVRDLVERRWCLRRRARLLGPVTTRVARARRLGLPRTSWAASTSSRSAAVAKARAICVVGCVASH